MNRVFVKYLHSSKIIGLILLVTCIVYGQNTNTNAEDNQILLNVTVSTKKGDLITKLKAENFKVYDGKKLQPISVFNSEDAPMSIGILIDKSKSTESKSLTQAQQLALSTFITKSHPDNEYFLMAFNITQNFLLDNTEDGKKTLQAIQKLSTIKSEGNTKYYDSVWIGLEKLSKSKYSKKVLLIFSDGMDNESKNDFGDIKKIIKHSDALLYNISIFTSSSEAGSILGMQAAAFNEELTAVSGGKVLSPQTISEVNEALVKLAEELRSQYVIGFKTDKATDKNKKESWRDVKIKVELPALNSVNAEKIIVRTREGYYLNAKSN